MTNWTKQTVNTTSWNNQTIQSTSFNGRDITNLGVIMDDTVYKMDDSIATVDDMKLNSLFAPAANWSYIGINPTQMYGRYIPILFAIGDDTGYIGDDSILTGDDLKLNNIYSPATTWANQ